MPVRPDLITNLFEKEATYWWNVSKRELVFSLLEGIGFWAKTNRGFAVDIGCGGGYMVKVLEPHCPTIGVDVSSDALLLCRTRNLSRLCQVDMATLSLPFKNNSFDLVLALDVIEHIDDDVHALTECRRILRPGGLIIVTVPAFMWLWSPWDEALGHRRRYTAFMLTEAMRRAGLTVHKMTYTFFFVFPIAVLVRGVKRLIQKSASYYSSDFIPIPGILNRALIQVGRLECWIITKLNWRLPFGLSVISCATKR